MPIDCDLKIVFLFRREVNTCPVAQPQQIFGRNVAKLRVRAQLTQERLAEKAEISHRYLQSIEAGAKQPGINVVARIHKGLGADWNELMAGLP